MSAEPFPLPPPGDAYPGEEPPSIPEVLTALRDLVRVSPEGREILERFLSAAPGGPGGRLRLVGRARKVSVSMPQELTEAVQQRVGRGAFSQYVTEAVARRLELDLLGELSALLEAEHGALSEEALNEARLSWPDAR